MATAATSRPSNTKQRTTLPNRPPRSGLETNRPSLHQTQGDSKVMDFGVPDGWVTWFRDAVQPRTATVALLVEDLDRDAFVAETTRFTGAELGVCQPRRRNQRTGQGRLLRPRTGHPQQPLKPTAACAVVQASAHPSAKHERERSALTISTGAPIPRSRDPRVAQRLTGVVQ